MMQQIRKIEKQLGIVPVPLSLFPESDAIERAKAIRCYFLSISALAKEKGIVIPETFTKKLSTKLL